MTLNFYRMYLFNFKFNEKISMSFVSNFLCFLSVISRLDDTKKAFDGLSEPRKAEI